jgi:cell division protein ZapA (FtsZ GTPase activity inhibitor)
MRNQLISVIIAERPYRLTVMSEEEEEVFRKAASLVEEKMQKYASNFAFRDKQDLLAMVNLQFAVEYLRLDDTAKRHRELKEKMQSVDRLLDKSLLERS